MLAWKATQSSSRRPTGNTPPARPRRETPLLCTLTAARTLSSGRYSTSSPWEQTGISLTICGICRSEPTAISPISTAFTGSSKVKALLQQGDGVPALAVGPLASWSAAAGPAGAAVSLLRGGDPVRYRRMPIEVESPEQVGYSTIANNLSESSVSDRRLGDLGLDLDLEGLLLCYGDHLGDPFLREAIAAPGTGLAAGDVTVTPGAAAALFCIATAILSPGDHAVVVRTNYATNLETPRAINADVDIVDLRYEDRWALDIDKLQSRVQPGRTKMISVTCPHNPTGAMLEAADL